MEGTVGFSKNMKDQHCWRGFKVGSWCDTIDVRDFIVSNVTPYAADERFLVGSSTRTKAVWDKLQPYFKEERKKGVLDADAKMPSTMLAHKAGYIDRNNEVIVGLQTDQPFKRAIFPFGGLRMVEAGLKAAGFAADANVHEIFTKYRKTHNDGVFDAYTPEIMRCRRSGIITGLPDAYGRGRIIGDYRRVALYGVANLLEAKRAERKQIDEFFGARVNLPKALLYAINGGRDEISGDQVAPPTASVTSEVLDYNEVFEKFDATIEWLARTYVHAMNCIHYMHDKYFYERLEMAFHDRDVLRTMAFGIAGLSVVADSLAAIKYAKVHVIRDDTGLAVDYRIEANGPLPQFGNNDDRVDGIAADLVTRFMQKTRKHPTYRGATHTQSVLTITSNVVYGKATGNTPDGRRKANRLRLAPVRCTAAIAMAGLRPAFRSRSCPTTMRSMGSATRFRWRRKRRTYPIVVGRCRRQGLRHVF